MPRYQTVKCAGREQWAFELNYAKSTNISLANNMPRNKVEVYLLVYSSIPHYGYRIVIICLVVDYYLVVIGRKYCRDFQRLSLYTNPIRFLAIMKGVANAVGSSSVFYSLSLRALCFT